MGLTAAPTPYKVIKLDGRFTGRSHFEYCIDFRNRGSTKAVYERFIRARRWFWETHGPSAEFGIYVELVPSIVTPGQKISFTELTDRWAWQTEFHQCRIYVKDDATLSGFIMFFQ